MFVKRFETFKARRDTDEDVGPGGLSSLLGKSKKSSPSFKLTSGSSKLSKLKLGLFS